MVFQPKLVPRCAFIPPLLCAKFQGNRIRRSRFIAVFVSVQKEEEKKEEKKKKKLSQVLKSHISGTPEAISLKAPASWAARHSVLIGKKGDHLHLQTY